MSVDLTIPREYQRRAEAALPGRIAKIVLFGSRARGEARDDSDWDIAVFMPGPITLDEEFALSDVGTSILFDYGISVQSVPLRTEREQMKTSFMMNLHDDGIVI
jgi:uncharacterized protein